MEIGKIIKHFKSKNGRDVVIRHLGRGDLDDLLTYANNLSREDTFVMLSGERLTRKQEEKYLDESIKQMKKREKVHLVVVVGGAFAGNAEIRRQRRRKKHVGEVAISLDAKFRDEGIGTELLRTLIDEGKKLGLRALTLSCFENNERALHLYEKAGFKRAGFIPGMYHYKGKYVGEVLFYLPLAKDDN